MYQKKKIFFSIRINRDKLNNRIARRELTNDMKN